MTPRTPIRVRLAIRSDRWLKRTLAALRSVHQGVWLGVLRSSDLAAANAAAYSHWERYRDDAYNKSGLADWERDAIQRYFSPRSRVLVPSAGGGREILGLEGLGYRVVGFDPSQYLVAYGQGLIAETGGKSQLMLSPPDALPVGFDERFDAILVGWGGYVHIRTRLARVAFLQGLRHSVDAGAPMIISFFLRAPTDRTFPATKTVASLIRKVRRSSEPIELGDTVAATFDHYFTWDEIEAELAEGGFIPAESSSAPYPHLVCRAI